MTKYVFLVRPLQFHYTGSIIQLLLYIDGLVQDCSISSALAMEIQCIAVLH